MFKTIDEALNLLDCYRNIDGLQNKMIKSEKTRRFFAYEKEMFNITAGDSSCGNEC